MFKVRLSSLLVIVTLLGASLVSLHSATPGQAANPSTTPGYLWMVQRMETEALGVPNPTGLTYSPAANAFLLLDAEHSKGQANIVMMTPFREPAGSVSLTSTAGNPALNMAFDGKSNRLLLLDASTKRMAEVKANQKGKPDPVTATSYDASRFAPTSTAGMAVNSKNGRLYILDNSGSNIVIVDPDAQGSHKNGRLAKVNLKQKGLTNLRGLAVDPASGHLYTMDVSKQILYELTEDGQVVSERDLAELSDYLKLWNPGAMVFAPSGDQTDDPAQQSLYIADSGPAPGQDPTGAVVELSLTAPILMDATSYTKHATLVNVVDTSLWADPSTDPSGIDYLPASGTYLVSDGEIEEYNHPYWHGGNLFSMSPSGALLALQTTFTANPTSLVPNNFSSEPTGVAQDSKTGALLFSDDDKRQVFMVKLGRDGRYGTEDDIVTAFSTSAFGCGDPEGAAFDSKRGHILIADGVNKEVYDVSPGANGIFDGVPPAGDDSVTSFDTSTIPGLGDVEGIEYDQDTGHIYLTGPAMQIDRAVVETTIAGDVVGIYPVPNPVNPAGLAYGPGSTGGGAKHIYLSDRGVGPEINPLANDGRVYELSIEASDSIFADGFESGSFLKWSAASTDGGDLAITTAAALAGTKGLQATIDDANTIYVQDDWPDSETQYRARFLFDPNSLAMATADTHYIFYGYNVIPTSTGIMRIELRPYGGSYEIRAYALTDNSSVWVRGDWIPISDAPHTIEINWKAATVAGANDGAMVMSVDGAIQTNLTGIDNDTWRMDRVRLGAVSAVDATTSGTEYFDGFESWSQFDPPDVAYQVDISANPAAGGSINPESGTYSGSQSFTATSASGYRFIGWTINGSAGGSANPITVDVTSPTTIVANFEQVWPVTVESSGNGSVSPASGDYTGETVFTATPDSGYVFKDWTIIGSTQTSSTDNPLALDVTEPLTVRANFSLITYDVTVSADEGGSVSPGSGRYAGSQTFAATADGGYQFVNWTVDSVTGEASNPLTVDVTGPTTITAHFKRVYAVAVSAGIGGTVDPPSGNYAGETAFTATADAGHYFAGWTINGEPDGSTNPLTIDITADTTVAADFQKITYPVTVSASPAGGGSVIPGSGKYTGSCKFTATASSGYYFVNWTVNGVTGETANPFTINITAATTLVANFQADLVFANGFESGNLSNWTSAATDSGHLSVSTAAAVTGQYGLQAAIRDNNSMYVQDDSPNRETRYRARFYFDPNSITMLRGNAHYIFYGYNVNPTSTGVLRIEFRKDTAYQIRGALMRDGGTWVQTSWFTISDAPHLLEIDWRAATGARRNNGGLTLWIDAVQKANLTGVDNDTWRIDRIRLGAVSGVDSGTRGTEYFDDFESWR